jgi:hypothetical protein
MKTISDVVEGRIELAAGTAKYEGVSQATFVRLCEQAYDNFKPDTPHLPATQFPSASAEEVWADDADVFERTAAARAVRAWIERRLFDAFSKRRPT